MEKRNFVLLKDTIVNIDRCLYIEKDSNYNFINITFSEEEFIQIQCNNDYELESTWNLLIEELKAR